MVSALWIKLINVLRITIKQNLDSPKIYFAGVFFNYFFKGPLGSLDLSLKTSSLKHIKQPDAILKRNMICLFLTTTSGGTCLLVSDADKYVISWFSFLVKRKGSDERSGALGLQDGVFQ